MAHIFISYSRKDVAFADQLVTILRDAGREVWIDRSNIPGGTQWQKEIDDAIKACDVMMVIVSDQSIESENVEHEIDLGVKLKKKIIPFSLGNRLHPKLTEVNHINAPPSLNVPLVFAALAAAEAQTDDSFFLASTKEKSGNLQVSEYRLLAAILLVVFVVLILLAGNLSNSNSSQTSTAMVDMPTSDDPVNSITLPIGPTAISSRPSPSGNGVNVIENGDFEAASLSPWEIQSNQTDAMPDVGLNGGTSFKLVQKETSTVKLIWSGLKQYVDVEDSQIYRVSAWVKGENAVGTHMKVVWLDGDRKDLGQATFVKAKGPDMLTFDWELFEKDVVAPPGAKHAYVAIWHGATGSNIENGHNVPGSTIWVDDVSMVGQ